MTEATKYMRAKNENNEHEMRDLRSKAAAAETARDWYVMRIVYPGGIR